MQIKEPEIPCFKLKMILEDCIGNEKGKGENKADRRLSLGYCHFSFACMFSNLLPCNQKHCNREMDWAISSLPRAVRESQPLR